MILQVPTGQRFHRVTPREKGICVPDRPEVHGLAMALVIKHFWCNVAEASSKGCELLF